MADFLYTHLAMTSMIISVSLAIGIVSIILGLSKQYVPANRKNRPLVGIVFAVIFLGIAIIDLVLVLPLTIQHEHTILNQRLFLFLLSILIIGTFFTILGYFVGLQVRKNMVRRL